MKGFHVHLAAAEELNETIRYYGGIDGALAVAFEDEYPRWAGAGQ
jgi:hypothetical protein